MLNNQCDGWNSNLKDNYRLQSVIEKYQTRYHSKLRGEFAQTTKEHGATRSGKINKLTDAKESEHKLAEEGRSYRVKDHTFTQTNN